MKRLFLVSTIGGSRSPDFTFLLSSNYESLMAMLTPSCPQAICRVREEPASWGNELPHPGHLCLPGRAPTVQGRPAVFHPQLLPLLAASLAQGSPPPRVPSSLDLASAPPTPRPSCCLPRVGAASDKMTFAVSPRLDGRLVRVHGGTSSAVCTRACSLTERGHGAH